ncbi:hypothetical protein [Nocardioides sp. W7]|uniref:DUF7144 family membrane protein n=1 Tax=Nocardioides sp. W7 TaxID=2931390 RepID=UPI001FCFD671|nr:hypothetical protein [Nocardioides sp. W7]
MYVGAEDTGFAWGLSAFAGIMLATLASMQVLQGIAALAKDDVYFEPADYMFAADLTTWGWIHLVLGAVGVVVGMGILAQQGWAQLGGIVIAVLAALANFLFVPYYPGWALTLLAFNLLLIWALTSQFRGRSRTPTHR